MNPSSRQNEKGVSSDSSIEVTNRQKFSAVPTYIPSNQYLNQNHEHPRQWRSNYHEPQAFGGSGMLKQWQSTKSRSRKNCPLRNYVDLSNLTSEATSEVMQKLGKKISSDSYLHHCAAIITNTVNKTIDKAYAEAVYEKQCEYSEQHVNRIQKPESETVLPRMSCNCKVARPRKRLTKRTPHRPYDEKQSSRSCNHSRIPISLNYLSCQPRTTKKTLVSRPVQTIRKWIPTKLTRATFEENKNLHITPVLNKFVQTSVEKFTYNDAPKHDLVCEKFPENSGNFGFREITTSKEIGLPKPVAEKWGLMSRNMNTDLPLEHCTRVECEKGNCTSNSEIINKPFKNEHSHALREVITDKLLKTNSNYMMNHCNRSFKIDLTDLPREPIQIELNLKLRDPVKSQLPQKEVVEKRQVKAINKIECSVTESLPRYRCPTECTRQRDKDKAEDRKKINRERRSPRYLMMAQTRMRTPSNVIWAAKERKKMRLELKKLNAKACKLGNKQSRKNLNDVHFPSKVDVISESQSRTPNENQRQGGALDCDVPSAREQEAQQHVEKQHETTMKSCQTTCSNPHWVSSSSFESKAKANCSGDCTVADVKAHPKVNLSISKHDPRANSSNVKISVCKNKQISECDRFNFTLKDYAELNAKYNRLLENLSASKSNSNYLCSRADLGKRLQKSFVAGTSINLSQSCSTTHKMKMAFRGAL